MDTSRAAVITEHNKPLTIEQVPIPKLDPGSLLVKITASTLCGTDVHRKLSQLFASVVSFLLAGKWRFSARLGSKVR